jgi:S1-C subfamily serine protease
MIKRITLILGLGVAAVVAGCGSSDEPNKPEGPQKLGPQALIKQAGPATVKLYGKVGMGSGVVLDAKAGTVLTNAHVVDGNSGLKARVNDEETDYTARVEATAPCEDLAIVTLTTPPTGLKEMPVGQSGRIKPGQHVSTLGYPGTAQDDGIGTTKLVYGDGRVSVAETSANLPGLGEYQSLIQHTATTNPGNSGGPLVDDYGRLLGINTLGSNETQQQFYSIAIDHAKPIIAKLKQGISLSDVGWSLTELDEDGLALAYVFEEYGRPVSEALKVANYLAETDQDTGLLVLNTRAGTPAGRSNLVTGDYIQSIDGVPVSTVPEACDVFESATPGSIVKVEGMWLSSAYSDAVIDNPDITVGKTFTQNVRVPEEEEAK